MKVLIRRSAKHYFNLSSFRRQILAIGSQLRSRYVLSNGHEIRQLELMQTLLCLERPFDLKICKIKNQVLSLLR